MGAWLVGGVGVLLFPHQISNAPDICLLAYADSIMLIHAVGPCDHVQVLGEFGKIATPAMAPSPRGGFHEL